ncbi:MAG: Protein FecR [Pseudomonas sp.]|nr:MAG: Protein FecR [Pseudomonas sp.]
MTTPLQPERPLSAEDETLARHREELRKRFPLPTPKPRKPRKGLIAGALLVLVSAGLVWLDPAYRTEHYSSAIGERRVLDLTDGSRLVLDSNTRVEVSWHLRTRQVKLASGQVLFNVRRTLIRPFLVDAGTARIKVLGTQFNVFREPYAVHVALMRGSVHVESTMDPTQHMQLIPGQQAEVRHGQLRLADNADIPRILAWRDRRLMFSHTPLSEAIAQIQRYRQAPIRLDDERLASLEVSGVFNTNKVEELLDLLPRILPVALKRDADGTVHLTRKVAKK